jgi:hypothetical protein
MARTRSLVALFTALACSALTIQAQSGDPALIQQKLLSQFKLAKSTADHTDLVTAGDVIVLQKDGLMMCSSASSFGYGNTYTGGVLAASEKNRAKDAAKSFLKGKMPFGGGGSASDAANNGCQSRKFVTGEKFWITGINAQKDGVTFGVISDPYQNLRYYGEIKFVFNKGTVPSPDDFVKTVAELLTVDASNAQQQGNDSNAAPAQGQGQQQGQGQAQGQQQPAQQPTPMADIAPPPPPADTPPPTIAIGQTVDQVTGAFGQPTRIANLGPKQIYYYKDMKVTFVKGKVSDIQ